MNVFEDRHVESFGVCPNKIYRGTFSETGELKQLNSMLILSGEVDIYVEFYQSTQHNTYHGGYKDGEIEVKMSIVAGVWEGEWGIARGGITYEGPLVFDETGEEDIAMDDA